jgi:hypothetical protein
MNADHGRFYMFVSSRKAPEYEWKGRESYKYTQEIPSKMQSSRWKKHLSWLEKLTKEGRKERRKKRRKEGSSREVGKEGRKGEEGRKEGRKKGRKEGKREGRKKGRKEGREEPY